MLSPSLRVVLYVILANVESFFCTLPGKPFHSALPGEKLLSQLAEWSGLDGSSIEVWHSGQLIAIGGRGNAGLICVRAGTGQS
ncbi:hypothetical protein J2805_003369 [Arthrobacter oryzae]|nr:hypothetical protein [Arthrobacter oryzae]